MLAVLAFKAGGYFEELEDLEVIEMPPYTVEELEEIVRERVVRLMLPADEGDVREAAAQALVRSARHARHVSST